MRPSKTSSLYSALYEDAQVTVPDTEAQVDEILDDLDSDAGETLTSALDDDPEVVDDFLKDNPEAVERHLKSTPEAVSNLSGALEDPEVMSTLSQTPESIAAMSSYYSDNPEDIPDPLVRQISDAISDDKDTPKGDIVEYYEHMLDRHHIDGQPWSGTLQDLASQQGRSFGGADLVDAKRFDKEVRTSVKFATGTASSPLKITERKLRLIIRSVLVEARSW